MCMKSFTTASVALGNYVHTISRKFVNYPTEIFIFLALIFGGLFVFQLPPLNGTDEFTHFPRVYQISQGTFWEQKLPDSQYGGYLPNNINNMVNDYRKRPRN